MQRKNASSVSDPATVEISQYCPGAVGSLAWLAHSEPLLARKSLAVKLEELMATTNVRQILEESKYKGQKEEE
jgi:hypothetical protein